MIWDPQAEEWVINSVHEQNHVDTNNRLGVRPAPDRIGLIHDVTTAWWNSEGMISAARNLRQFRDRQRRAQALRAMAQNNIAVPGGGVIARDINWGPVAVPPALDDVDVPREHPDVPPGRATKYKDLKVTPVEDGLLPKFKFPFETAADAALRWQNAVVLINQDPYIVAEIGRDLTFYLHNSDGERFKVPYQDIPDLRTPEPRYCKSEYGYGYYFRKPSRVQTQGLVRDNTYLKMVGTGGLNTMRPTETVKALRPMKNEIWTEPLGRYLREDVIPQIRLSNKLAAYHAGPNLKIEYKGRELGVIVEDAILVFDKDDLDQSWIHSAASEVGLRLRG